jgi:hypothetical protein
MSTTLCVHPIALNLVVQEARSRITLHISVVRKHPLLRSEEVPHPLLSSTKVVMLLPTHNLLQWMSTISLIQGMHPILILLPVIADHLVLPQTLTHAIRMEYVVQLLTTHITVVPLVLGPCPLPRPFILVDLDHRTIMPILPAGFQFPLAPQVPTALLTHTPGNQVAMVLKTIEKVVGSVVSGNEAGSQVEGMLGHHIIMRHLRHLGP